MAKLKYACKKCKFINRRDVPWIDSKLYTDPDKACIKYGFWCKSCGLNVGVQYKCIPPDKILLQGEFNPAPAYSKTKFDPTRDLEMNEWSELGTIAGTTELDEETIEVVEE